MKIFRIVAPTSKSILQREIIVALLSEEPTRIEFDSLANDTVQALRIAEQIGDCRVEIAENYRILLAEECVARNFSADNLIYIKSCAAGCGEKSSAVIAKNFEKLRATREINCGESGLLLHLVAGYFVANLHGETVKISGEGTLNSRRVSDLIRVLEAIGLKVNHAGEFLPLEISGRNYMHENRIFRADRLAGDIRIDDCTCRVRRRNYCIQFEKPKLRINDSRSTEMPWI